MTAEPSIRRRLLVGVMSAILLIWILVIVLVYHASSHEIDEVYDAALASYARVLATLMKHEAEEEQAFNQQFRRLVEELGMETVRRSQVLSALLEKQQATITPEDYLSLDIAKSIPEHPYESKIAFLIKAADGSVLLRSSSDAPLSNDIDGYITRQINGESWRMFGLTDLDDGVTVVVGENIEIRTELQREILANGLWPFLVLLPVIIMAILGAISKGLRPLQTVTARVASRSPTSLTPLSKQGTPVEILPLVEALNDLFTRVQQALDNERRFTANAAHELRTPLAAIKTHAQVLQMNAAPDTQPSINQVIRGIDRASHMVQQLLTLARAEIKVQEGTTFHSLNLVSVTRNVMLDFANLALEKEINLSFDHDVDNVTVQADEALLQIVIQNLLDNAIRYTPAEGTVNVTLKEEQGKAVLTVEDSGPGIEPDKQAQMFQRFQRGEESDQLGVGLGLSIVNQVCQLHGIKLSMERSQALGGLAVTLIFSSRQA